MSDHTLGNTAAIVATSLGITFIEKHFTISRKNKGPDSSFSIEPREMKKLILECKKKPIHHWEILIIKKYLLSKKQNF